MGKSGKFLGILALLIAIGALGLSIYPLVVPSAPEGPEIYCVKKDNNFYLTSSTYETIPDLNFTYTTETGNSVLFELSCQLSIEIISPSTRVDFKFEIDGTPTTTEISAIGLAPDVYLHIPFMMRHNIPSSLEGSHVVKVLVKIDDTFTTSFVKFCILTAIVN